MRRALPVVAALARLAGCGGVDTTGVTSSAVVPLPEATLDAAANDRVVGIGEATHGNKEFVQVRLQVIKTLVERHGFRAVALEADFGGTAVADDYVTGGQGTAEDAAKALGFDLYRTRDTAGLLRWIHDHNATVPDAEKVHLLGFDMQRYDRNKERLLRHLTDVDPARAASAERSLSGLTDATRTSPPPAGAKDAVAGVISLLKSKREAYVRAGSEQAYAVAVHHAEIIRQGVELQSSGNDYIAKRDAWMAENIGWIAGQAKGKIIVAAHNGHIDKSGAAYSFESMGRRLAATYGDDYFAIGTDFGTSTFITKDSMSGRRQKFTVETDAPLAKLFGGEPMGYVDIAQASADPANRRLLNAKVPMGSVGDEFSALFSKLSKMYTVATVPAKAYDALVYVPHAGPVTPL
ncbi:erythromycin esterase family protein [Nonomuraea jiangxiensis]|uniref:Erythromycin esterase n=1 Tax=Nonomuraea jiangxiensis TaxID=633440 RepID=A0A1G8P5M6_9ACTN|nr:erythromycin esterase family protein [Nonomuraea jiangxiensis]SDI87794.1 erythromycin esterase [Nonomuraea jiangxiensis]